MTEQAGRPVRDTARVTASFGRRCLLLSEAGDTLAARPADRHMRPVCGDLVALRSDGAAPVIEAILPRRTTLYRHTPGARRAVAANIDCLLIVAAPRPVTGLDQIDRYLALARLCGVQAHIVAGKCDLADFAEWAQAVRDYRALGYPVSETSTKTGDGVQALRAALEHRHCAMAGLSGAGKSSLINALFPDAQASTQALSGAGAGQGRHTTTASRLYSFAAGGWIIDAPGVRDIRLWAMPAAELAAGFVEFSSLIAHCRFNDCRHCGEPGCALAAAVERGEISARRLDSYRRLLAFVAP